MSKPTLAVVGATGAVGTVMLDILSTREDVWGEIRLRRLGPIGWQGAALSGRGCRRPGADRGRRSTVSTSRCSTYLTRSRRSGLRSRAAKGAVAVDNSGAFRMDPDVPLVVPEVNPDQVRNRPTRHHLQPQLHDADDDGRARCAARSLGSARAGRRVVPGGLRRRSGRQSTGCTTSSRSSRRPLARSVAGDVRRAIANKLGEESPFPAPLALNVVPWAGSMKDGGWSSEELKVRNESRKILGIPDLKVSATCVRVPGRDHALARGARRLRGATSTSTMLGRR